MVLNLEFVSMSLFIIIIIIIYFINIIIIIFYYFNYCFYYYYSYYFYYYTAPIANLKQSKATQKQGICRPLLIG